MEKLCSELLELLFIQRTVKNVFGSVSELFKCLNIRRFGFGALFARAPCGRLVSYKTGHERAN